MAVSLSTSDYNRLGIMRRFVSVYSQDADHVLRRRFARLHFYNLHQKHEKLVDLDEKMGILERNLSRSKKERCREPATDQPTETLDELLAEVSKGLNDFDAASKIYQRSVQAPEAPHFFLQQLQAAFETREQNFCHHYDIESGWSECALYTAIEKGVLHRWIDRNITRYPLLRWIFVKDGAKQDGVMLRYEEATVRLVEDVSINLGFCALLLIPTFLLTYVQNQQWKLAVVAGFVLLSTMLSSFMATATQKPSLAVVAGYAAILVVFLAGSNP